jgi:hypothetical protein
MAISAVLTTISSIRMTAKAADVLRVFGFPAIMTAVEMPI